MVGISFTKMNGSGNDFIIIDNRRAEIATGQKRELVRKMCAPKISVGADGVIFVENAKSGADFSWDFYNADGSAAEMCGNGSRCVARYALEKKIVSKPQMSFETLAGVIHAEVLGKWVKVKLSTPQDLRRGQKLELGGQTYEFDFLNTGVPHTVIFSSDVDKENVQDVGHGVRYHQAFAPKGTNVNFAQINGDGTVKIRTYERGVEGETLACGTGAVASAILSSARGNLRPPVSVATRGGEILKIYFQTPAPGAFAEVYLEGLTQIAFEGVIVEL